MLQVQPHQCQAEEKNHFHPSASNTPLVQPPLQQRQHPWEATQAATLKVQEMWTTRIKVSLRALTQYMWKDWSMLCDKAMPSKFSQVAGYLGIPTQYVLVKPLLTPLRGAPQKITTALGMEEFE